MSSLKFMHDVGRVAILKMQEGFEKFGLFNPYRDKQNLIDEGICEAADSYNYANMEKQKVICQYLLSPEDCEHLLQMLDNIAAASLQLGIYWCEYEAALKERLSKEGTDNDSTNT